MKKTFENGLYTEVELFHLLQQAICNNYSIKYNKDINATTVYNEANEKVFYYYEAKNDDEFATNEVLYVVVVF